MREAGIVRLTRTIRGDWPIGHHIVASPGDYTAFCNPQGAVSVKAANGKMLGLKPGEFEWVEKLKLQEPASTFTHMAVPLDVLQKHLLEGGPLADGVICHDDGRPLNERELWKLINEEKAKGYKYFVGCEHRNEEGRCLGHPMAERKDLPPWEKKSDE